MTTNYDKLHTKLKGPGNCQCEYMHVRACVRACTGMHHMAFCCHGEDAALVVRPTPFCTQLQHWENAFKDHSQCHSQAAPVTRASLVLYSLNRKQKSEDTHCCQRSSKRSKATFVPLPQGGFGSLSSPTGYNGSHFWATVPHSGTRQ